MKTKKSIWVAITAMLCMVAVPCLAADVAKIGMVNIQKILLTSAA